jgi:hypothetical protein
MKKPLWTGNIYNLTTKPQILSPDQRRITKKQSNLFALFGESQCKLYPLKGVYI